MIAAINLQFMDIAHFGIDRGEADGIFVPYHFERHTDERIRNVELDRCIAPYKHEKRPVARI